MSSLAGLSLFSIDMSSYATRSVNVTLRSTLVPEIPIQPGMVLSFNFPEVYKDLNKISPPITVTVEPSHIKAAIVGNSIQFSGFNGTETSITFEVNGLTNPISLTGST